MATKRYNWLLTATDPQFGPERAKFFGTEWECKLEIARRVRALRNGYSHIPGTEYARQVTKTIDGKLKGWCLVPNVGKVSYSATIPKNPNLLNGLRKSQDIDAEFGRYGDDIMREENHKYIFTGVPTITVTKV